MRNPSSLEGKSSPPSHTQSGHECCRGCPRTHHRKKGKGRDGPSSEGAYGKEASILSYSHGV